MKQQPLIPKEPNVPQLTDEQISELTEIIFLKEVEVVPCDAIFIFGGTHPGHWEVPIEAYNKGLGKTLIVTGGFSPTGVKHAAWEYGETPEAHVIVNKLKEAGISEANIVFEDRSRNSLENVLFAKEVFDFNRINSLLFVCKSHGAGRQYRSLAKHLPSHLSYIPLAFGTTFSEDAAITRHNWMETPKGRSRVYGEYLRIWYYGNRGDFLPLEKPVRELELLEQSN
jgi:uncharacterized SAM-binding protein YcdF (DUF218 family)